MSVRVGVVTFPGSLDDGDAARAVQRVGAEAVRLWHDNPTLSNVQAVVLPGGFSYGDYLRPGAIARMSPIMEKIIDAARGGMPVLGVCNGFQILCEAGLLPGALIKNAGRKFICTDQVIQIVNASTVWTNAISADQKLTIPIKNADGQFVADRRTLDAIEAEGRVVARYVRRNPNGSYRDIAGVTNEAGNVVGMMPHPEHAIDRLVGPSDDGLAVFASVMKALVNR
ncbi:phosphoribosylformylglycinamidine synthase subunit PurQ [Micromonospora sp. NPDC048999]|uniref:phosphoribosylformylglycinamidine synthase subunit PurQ n=1 Tax=Micromonospora sp. NPDC048999 TaxID=3155391 RepID=UPI0033C77694